MRCATCKGEGKWPTMFDICCVCNGDGTLPDSRIKNPDCPVCKGKGTWPTMFDICKKCDGWGKLPGKTTDILTESQNVDKTTISLDYTPIPNLITQGESHTLEFKETLQWSVKKEEHAPYLQKESLRTIAAFLNTEGGTLLIGVSDSGEINGIARDLPYCQGKEP